MHPYDSYVHRYPEWDSFSTSLSVADDLVGLLTGLTSQGVVGDVLRERHGVKNAKENRRSRRAVVDFVRQGLEFTEQARSGPSIASFLPLYYAFLQFAKAVIVADGGSNSVSDKEWHGLSYAQERSSKSLDSEVVKIWAGVFEKYYRVLTRNELPQRSGRKPWSASAKPPKHVMSMRDVYPYIQDASFEYRQARDSSREHFDSITLLKRVGEDGLTKVSLIRYPPRTSSGADGRASPLLAAFRGPEGPKRLVLPAGMEAQDCLPTYLLYNSLSRPFGRNEWEIDDIPLGNVVVDLRIPLWNGRIQYPEEIPLFVAFYHLSSIVRYKPRFVSQVCDSAYLPFLLALERHSAAKMCLLIYNALLRKSLYPQVPQSP